MKIIDEKGRLFGKINLIDFLVILFLLFFIPMFYFAYRIFTKNLANLTHPLTERQMVFILKEINPATLKLINLGDKELDENGETIGEIVWVGKAEQHSNIFDNGLGINQAEPDPVLKDLPVSLKLKVEIKDNAIYYKNKKVETIEPIYFKTKKYVGRAFLYVEEKIDLFITLKDLSDEQLKLISVGDKQLDNEGNTIFEILSLGKIENDKRDINLGNGNFTLGENNARKQIATKMRLKCSLGKDNKFYFEDEELAANSLFKFNTDKYSVIGKIESTFTSMPYKEKWVRLKVKFSGVIPEVADIVREGDIEKRPDEKITGKIIEIVASKAGDVLTVKDNKFLVVSNPFQKDIIASLDILCFEKEGTLYFKNYPVKMGNAITFSTDIYSLNGIIIGIEIK